METRIFDLLAITTHLDAKDIKHEDKLAEALGLDSLDITELIMDIEEDLNIDITDDELDSLVTVQDIIDIAKRKTEE